MLLPYKADLDIRYVPVVVLAVCVICVVVYVHQSRNLDEIVTTTERFCASPAPRVTEIVMGKIAGDHSPRACAELLWDIRRAPDPKAALREKVAAGESLAGFERAAGEAYATKVLTRRYRAFTRAVPDYQTQQLWYHPASWDPWSMVTAAFAHGSWLHLGTNLVFFAAFAVAVEAMLGPLIFAGLVAGSAIGTHTFYSLAMLAVPDPAPTLGLSGVVMAMLALFTFFLPSGRIRCLLFFILPVAIPAWVLALLYVGVDVYDLFAGEREGINLVAHVSGAGLGYLAGVMFFQRRRREIRAMAQLQ